MVRNSTILFVSIVALFALPSCAGFQAPPVARSPLHSTTSLADDSGEGAHEEAESERKKMELAWRSIKKPLISIGAKGVAASHANSLRELLAAHTVVKVKIRHFDGVEAAFAQLSELAQQDMELLQCRESEGIAMIGAKGAKAKIADGSFPPPPVTED